MSLPRGYSKRSLSLFLLVRVGVLLSSFVRILCSDSAHGEDSAPIVLRDHLQPKWATLLMFASTLSGYPYLVIL